MKNKELKKILAEKQAECGLIKQKNVEIVSEFHKIENDIKKFDKTIINLKAENNEILANQKASKEKIEIEKNSKLDFEQNILSDLDRQIEMLQRQVDDAICKL